MMDSNPSYAVASQTPTAQQPVQIVYLNRPQAQAQVKYGRHDLTTVKWISGFQLGLSILCLLIQSVTVGFFDYWLHEQKAVRSQYANARNVYTSLYPADSVGSGIWAGVLMIIMSAIGVASWKRNKKSLIVAYLVLSVFALLMSIAVITTSAISVNELKQCRHYGVYASVYRSYYRFGISSSRVYLLGEVIDDSDYSNYSRFYCKNALFPAWIALDAILICVSVLMFILTLLSLVYTSKAACRSCCSCCRESNTRNAAPPSVFYNAQPQPFGQSIQQPYQQPVVYGLPSNTVQVPVAYAAPSQSAGVVYPYPMYTQPATGSSVAASTHAMTSHNASEPRKEAAPPAYSSYMPASHSYSSSDQPAGDTTGTNTSTAEQLHVPTEQPPVAQPSTGQPSAAQPLTGQLLDTMDN